MAIEHRLGMLKWHASRTPEQKAATSLKLSDAAACRLWVRNGRGNSKGRPGVRKQMDPNTKVGTTTLRKMERASIKAIIRELATTQPELFRDALIDGLMAPAPRSFPYVALAAAYLDGKPPTEAPVEPVGDLSALSNAQLAERAERLVRLLKADPRLPVIDVTPVVEPTLEELEEQVKQAQADAERANADAHHARNAVVVANEELARIRGQK